MTRSKKVRIPFVNSPSILQNQTISQFHHALAIRGAYGLIWSGHTKTLKSDQTRNSGLPFF